MHYERGLAGARALQFVGQLDANIDRLRNLQPCIAKQMRGVRFGEPRCSQHAQDDFMRDVLNHLQTHEVLTPRGI